MYVWLHTSSPPQHIGHLPFEGSVSGLETYLRDTNARHGINARIALIVHDERTHEDRVHIFDHEDRAVNWTQRNNADVEVIHLARVGPRA